MTTNQINLLKIRLEDDRQRKQLSEDRRHNIATEGEAAKHNRETESLGRATLASTDAQWKSNLQESSRHNLTTERETQRSNLARERAEMAKLDETKRSNLVREWQNERQISETQRSNLAREQETKRSNLAHELETKRSNLAKETETVRGNIAQESISMERNAIQRDSDIRNALLRAQELELKKVAQDQDFQIAKDRNLETMRHNLATEDLSSIDQDIARDKISMEEAKLAETMRSNRESERIQRLTNSGRILVDSQRNVPSWVTSLFK